MGEADPTPSHDHILHQKEAKSKWITLKLVLYATEMKVVAINANSEDTTNKTNNTLKTLEGLHGSIAFNMNASIVKAVNLYQQILFPALHVA